MMLISGVNEEMGMVIITMAMMAMVIAIMMAMVVTLMLTMMMTGEYVSKLPCAQCLGTIMKLPLPRRLSSQRN